MYTNNFEQLINFIYFIITGMLLSIIFDVFRVLRRSFKTSDIVTNIEDVIFGIITEVIILLSIFLFNNGQLRLYTFIGILIGIIFYMLLISKYFIKINITIINSIKKIAILVTKPIIIIINYIKILFLKLISFIFINSKYLLNKMFKIPPKMTKTNKKEIKEEGF